MLPCFHAVWVLLLTATVVAMQATCPGNRSPPPISWRCTPELGQTFFRGYQYFGLSLISGNPSPTTPPTVEDFSTNCLASFVADISSNGPFAAANKTIADSCVPAPSCKSKKLTCVPYPSCQSATIHHVITAVRVNFTNHTMYDGSNDFPECPLLNVSGAIVSYPNGRRFFSQVRITCPEGYVLDSKAQVFCSHDGSWIDVNGSLVLLGSYTEKACIPCFGPPEIPNGQLLVCPDQPNATIQCDSGYSFSKANNVLLFNRTTWSTPKGICNRTSSGCVPMQSVAHGNLLISSTRINSYAKVVCDENYGILVEHSMVICNMDANWDLTVQNKCLRVCPLTQEVRNGRLLIVSNHIHSTASVVCNQGYGVSNSFSPVTCTASGDWAITSDNYCSRVCPLTQVVRNGSLLIVSNHINSTASVVCNQGYGLSNNFSTVTCIASGHWALSSDNHCSRAACEVVVVPNARVFPAPKTSVDIGAITTIECNKPDIIEGTSPLVCVWSQGAGRAEWHESVPKCIPNCKNRPTVANGIIRSIQDANGHELQLIVECNVGYNLTGSAEITCINGMTWTASPTCDALMCGKVPIPTNGTASPGNDTIFSVRTYSCNQGFTLQGIGYVTCIPSGDDATWSGSAPSCIRTRCKYRPSVPNGVVYYIQNGDGIEIKAVVECNVGFNLTGPKEVSCFREDSRSATPTCEALRCGNISIPDNGEVSEGNDTVFSVREYTCNSGFKLDGQSRVSCLPSRVGAEWSGNTPQCTHIRCAIPEESGSRTYSISGKSVNTTLVLVCEEGFTTGTTAARCIANGSWTGLDGMVCTESNDTSAATNPTVTPSKLEKQILTNTTSIVILAVIGALAALIVLLLIFLVRLRRRTSSSVYTPEEDSIPMQEPTKKQQSKRSIISNTAAEDRPSGQEEPEHYDTLQRPDGSQASGATAPVAESDGGDLYDHLQPALIEATADPCPMTEATKSNGAELELSAADDLYATVDTKNTDSGKSPIELQAIEADHLYGTVDTSAKQQRSTKHPSDNGDEAAEADEYQPPPPSRDLLGTPADDPEVPAFSSEEAKLV